MTLTFLNDSGHTLADPGDLLNVGGMWKPHS